MDALRHATDVPVLHVRDAAHQPSSGGERITGELLLDAAGTSLLVQRTDARGHVRHSARLPLSPRAEENVLS